MKIRYTTRSTPRSRPGSSSVRGHLVPDMGVGDLALGADDPLAHGGLRDEERAGYLGGGQAADRPQRERDLRRLVKRGVTAGEDQPEPVIVEHAFLTHRGMFLVVQADQLTEPGGSVRHRTVPAEPVDRPSPGRDGDPGTGVARDAVPGPGGERGLECVLHRVLGQLEVADLPDQGRQDGRALVAEDALDRRGRPGRGGNLVVARHA